MHYSSVSIEALIDEFAKLPGVGRKTAQRLAMHILHEPRSEAAKLADALLEVKDKVIRCSICQNVTDRGADPCAVCTSRARDRSVICVVESPVDMLAFEKTGYYKGLYHVLHGVISPLDGIGPKDIRIDELIKRLKKDKIKEVIIATDADSKGETTAFYLAEQIKPLNIKVTRLGYGLPVGGDLEYADELTLTRAIEGRREM